MGKKDRLALLRNWQSIEQISYALVWAVLIILPLIFWDFNDPGQQRRIIGGWIRILPFLLIFLIHNFILLPRLLLRKHYLAYALVTLAVIVLVNYWFIFNETFHDLVFRWMENRGGMHEGIDRIREHEMHPGRSSGTGHRTGGGRYWRWHSPVYLIFTYNLLISLLVVTFNTVLKFTSGWLGQEQHRKEIEKEAVRSQLTALQNQVSPHFFMNTLNNIHALIDYNQEDAKEAILRLSNMMRYLLYGSEHGKTSLAKEIEFLHSYIDLMKLRLRPEVDLKVEFPISVPDVQIYSLLTLSFIENAFKHGIDPRRKSYINIRLEAVGDRIHFNIRNSKGLADKEMEKEGGIGIENARKRLELLYDEDYSLNIYDREKEFEVDLIYPVS